MKKKLTPLQVEIRDIFRRTVVTCCRSKTRFKMFNVINSITLYLGTSETDAIEALAEIPSIGRFQGGYDAITWLAAHYRPVSNAVLDGKSMEEILLLWSKTRKKTLHAKWNITERAELRRHVTLAKELGMGRRYAHIVAPKISRSDWSSCKGASR